MGIARNGATAHVSWDDIVLSIVQMYTHAFPGQIMQRSVEKLLRNDNIGLHAKHCYKSIQLQRNLITPTILVLDFAHVVIYGDECYVW